jgi:lipopolysaccharide export system protein LptA
MRAVGLIVAGLTGAGAVALIGWSVLRSDAAPDEQANQLPADIAPAPERTPPTSASPIQVENITDLVDTAGEGHIELVDDENRVVQELFYDTFSPQESGRFFVEAPRAWVYLANGRTIFITAQSLRYLQPAGAREPESGRFEGGVEMRVFAPAGADDTGLRARDVDESDPPAPVLTVQMDSMNFDSGIGELSTADNVRVESLGVTASFDGLTIVIDEQRKRLAYLRTDGNGRVTVRPGELRRDDEPHRASGGGEGSRETEPVLAGVRQPYRAEFSETVRVRAGSVDLRADVLEAWALLIDGRLPSDAIAPLTASRSTGGAASSTGGEADVEAANPAEAIEEVLVSWSGPLTVRPLEEAPPELANDSLNVRFTAATGGAVILTDDNSGASLRASAIGYGLTSRALLLDGAGPRGVAMRAPEQGELLTSRVEVNLTNGQGSIPGPGVLRTIAAQPSDERSISWQERADFVLAVVGDQVDLSSTWPLQEAIFRGDATAAAPGATVQGEFIRSLFVERAAGGPGLSRVIVEGGARADAGTDGRLTARRVDVEFDPEADGETPTPRLITAEGRVRADRDGDALEAELVEAQVVRSEGGDLRVSNLRADLDVRVTTAKGERIEADDLRADLLGGVFDLSGRQVTLASGGASLEGKSMRIEEAAERLTVFGEGALRYMRTEADESPYSSALVTWTDSMTYDGIAGIAEFTGACDATAQTDDLGRDGARAHRVIVALVREGANADADSGRIDRNIQRVQLISAQQDGVGDAEAEFESRRYRADAQAPGGVRLESLVFLASSTIDADVAADTLTTPAPGRLLFEDRRNANTEHADADDSGISTRGTTLFEWAGGLTMNRSSGEAEMTRAVRLRHLPPGGDEAAELESERLSAKFALPNDQVGVARLLSAEAAGAVYLRRGTRQLIADRLLYDAGAGVAEALAAPGNAVTIFDANQPTPLTGSMLRLDLVRDRIEWRDAGETSIPR